VCVDSGSANSEQENVVECQGTGNNGDMDESGSSRVLEVLGREVEEVDDEQHLSEPEVAAAPEVDETEEEKVVEDEVRANIGGSLDVDLVLRVQVPAVSNLQDEQDDHVDGGDDGVEGKGGVVVRVLVPDGASVVLALGGRIERVVDAGHDQEEPRGSRQDLVASKATGGVRLAVHEGVDCHLSDSCLMARVMSRLTGVDALVRVLESLGDSLGGVVLGHGVKVGRKVSLKLFLTCSTKM
jgi:hypothetical protein